MVWQTVPQNSGLLVYSQVVALTVTAMSSKTMTTIAPTIQRIGGRKRVNHPIIRRIVSSFGIDGKPKNKQAQF